MKDLLTAIEAVTAGIAITVLIYWLLNLAVQKLPEKTKRKLEPYVFIGPVLLLIGFFVVFVDEKFDVEVPVTEPLSNAQVVF